MRLTEPKGRQMMDAASLSRHEVNLAPENYFSFNWNRKLVELIGSVRSDSFPSCLVNSLAVAELFDFVTLYYYEHGAAPKTIYHNVKKEEEDYLVEYYVDDPFKMDPVSHSAWNASRDIFMSLRAPGFNLEDSEYYRCFYRDTGLVDEVAYIVNLSPSSALVLNLLRKAENGSFTRDGMQRLSSQQPIVCELMRQHWRDFIERRQEEPGPRDTFTLLRSRLGAVLTLREIEIASMVLDGFSSEAIGLNLSISTGTVKVHRKNIYRKLQIGSQAELFSLVMNDGSPGAAGWGLRGANAELWT